MYIAQIGAAGELIVIEVEMRSSGSPSSRTSMSASELTATPQVPNSPSASGIVGVVAVERGHVVRDRQPGLAGPQQLVEALVRVLGRAEAGEHAHRPQPRPIAGAMDAARERRLAGKADVAHADRSPTTARRPAQAIAEVVDRGRTAAAAPSPVEVERRVQPVDLDVADGAEARPPLGSALLRPLSVPSRQALSCSRSRLDCRLPRLDSSTGPRRDRQRMVRRGR